jgi:hypothetical protein
VGIELHWLRNSTAATSLEEMSHDYITGRYCVLVKQQNSSHLAASSFLLTWSNMGAILSKMFNNADCADHVG